MSEFQPAFDSLLKWEGGFQNIRADRGNWTSGIVGVGEQKGTKWGISAMSYPQEDIENIDLDRTAYLYKRDYWLYGPINDQGIGTKMLNMAVNWQRYGGHGPAIHVLQQSIMSMGQVIDDDGSFGPATINAANSLPAENLLVVIRQKALARYYAIEIAHPEEKQFFEGWERRAVS